MTSINFNEINYLAVLAAGLGTFVLGGAWYTALFGKAWIAAHGYSEEQAKAMQADKPMPVFFGVMIVCYLIIAMIIAILAQASGANTAASGALLGFLLWVIAAAIGLTNHIPTNVKFGGYFIDTVYQLIYLVGSGVLIGAWR